MTEKVNLAEKLASFDETWVPKVVGELNGQYVKVAKFEGEYVWHQHENEDEMFLVIRGQLTLKLRDRDVSLDAGEFFVVPRGVEHLPVAREEVWVLMFEPAETLNTGNLRNERTITDLEPLA